MDYFLRMSCDHARISYTHVLDGLSDIDLSGELTLTILNLEELHCGIIAA